VKLPRQTRSIAAQGKVLVTFKLSKTLTRQVRQALRRHSSVVATITAAPVAPLTGMPVARKVRAGLAEWNNRSTTNTSAEILRLGGSGAPMSVSRDRRDNWDISGHQLRA
jgi:hypothetical protein